MGHIILTRKKKRVTRIYEHATFKTFFSSKSAISFFFNVSLSLKNINELIFLEMKGQRTKEKKKTSAKLKVACEKVSKHREKKLETSSVSFKSIVLVT